MWKVLAIDCIISLRGQVWAHKTYLSPTFFIGVLVPSQESERSGIYVLWVSIVPLSTILILDFGIVPTVWNILFFILFNQARIWISNVICGGRFYVQ